MTPFQSSKRSTLGRALLAGVVAVAGVCMSFADARAEVRAREFKIGYQSPRGNYQTEGAEKLAEIVAKLSGGKMKVNVFPGGALGGDVQTISAVRAGTVDMITLSAGLLQAQVKEYGLLDLPFLFNSADEAMATVDGPFGKKLAEQLEGKGMVTLGWFGGGFRQLTNNKRPVAKLEDVKGLKLRVLQSPLFIDTWKALGANTVPMPFPELYTALEQGAVDGQENPAALLVAVKFNEVQKHMSLTRHAYLTATLVFSKTVWDQLNDEERKIFRDAAREAQTLWRAGADKEEKDAIAKLRTLMTVTDVPNAELDRFRAAAKPVVDKYNAGNDPEMVKILNESVAKARK